MFYRGASNEKSDADNYLENCAKDFVFDLERGIYTPKAYYKKRKGKRFQGFFKIAALILNALTLYFLIRYTHYARKQWIEAKRTADQSVISAGAAHDSAETAKKTLSVTVEQFRLDQRAWIVPDFPPEPSIRHTTSVMGHAMSGLIIVNNGKTQAVKVRIRATARVFEKGTKRLSFDQSSGLPVEIGILFPNTPHPVGIAITRQLANGRFGGITWSEVDQIDGAVFGYVTIKYQDVFSEQTHATHVVQYCEFLHGSFRVSLLTQSPRMPDLAEQCVQYNRAYDE